MNYIIVNKSNKRVRDLSGKITPVFEYPKQCQNFISKRLRGSEYLKWKKISPTKKSATTRR